jgi:Ricin-type beta-trefoil lectin domain-like/Pregnancy-associated plasma protein-A
MDRECPLTVKKRSTHGLSSLLIPMGVAVAFVALIPSIGFTQVDERTTYLIRNVGSGLVLDVMGGNPSSIAPVIQSTRDDGPSQRWRLIPSAQTGVSTFQIVCVNSGKCLDVVGGGAEAGAKIQQFTGHAGQNQQWSFVPAGGGKYYLQVSHSGLVLDVPGGSQNSGVVLQQWVRNGTDAQRWELIQSGNPDDRVPLMARVRLHAVFLSDSDGGRPATIEPENVQELVARANTVLVQAGVRLLFDPEGDCEWVRDTDLNSMSNGSSGAWWNLPNAFAAKYPCRLVVFFRYGGTGPTPATNAFAFPPRTDYPVPSSAPLPTDNVCFVAFYGGTLWSANKDTFAHEVGHFLGLYHTFPGWGDSGTGTLAAARNYINANGGGASALDGDGHADTPPEAGSTFYSNVVSTNQCGGSGNYMIGSLTFTPDRQNVMSYFQCPPYHFTPDQVALIRRTLDHPTRRRLVNPPSRELTVTFRSIRILDSNPRRTAPAKMTFTFRVAGREIAIPATGLGEFPLGVSVNLPANLVFPVNRDRWCGVTLPITVESTYDQNQEFFIPPPRPGSKPFVKPKPAVVRASFGDSNNFGDGRTHELVSSSCGTEKFIVAVRIATRGNDRTLSGTRIE